MTKLEDIQGIKVRVVQSPLYIDLFNTLGANAVPLPFPELYTALEQKTVDGQENPATVIQTRSSPRCRSISRSPGTCTIRRS